MSFQFKNVVKHFIETQKVEVEKIYVTGFPYRMETYILNLSIEINHGEFFYLNIPKLKISVSPLSLNKIFLQSESSSLKFKNSVQEFNISNNESRLAITIENGLIKRSILMFEDNEISYRSIFFNFNKKLSNIVLDGKINSINNKLDGNLQLDIYDKNGQKKFAAPISINDNVLKLLFFELDLSSLF